MQVEIKHRFSGETLYTAELPGETPSGMTLRLALEQATRARANLRGANLDGANLDGANLGGANLGGANLGGANLRGANLDGANLGGANLGGANLDGANLGGANLDSANLGGANLGGANLDGANLDGANLDGANLGGETLAKAPISILNLGWNVLVTDGYMQIGCQRHTHSEWAAFDDRQIAAMDGAHALRFWRANRDWLLGACAAHTAVEAAAAEAA